MKVLLISSSALETPPTGYGGLEFIVYILARELNKKGHTVAVACTSGSKLPEGVEHIRTNELSGERGLENVALQRYAYRMSEFDLIHDHSHSKLAYTVFRDHPNEYKFLSTSHDPGCVNYPVDKPNIVCVSKSHAKNFKEQMGYKCKVVYNAIEPSMFNYTEEKSCNYLFIGRPTPDKGIIQAIGIAKELDVPLDVVAGRVGDFTPEAVRAAQLCRLGSKWKWWSAISHEKKAELLANAKAMIFPIQWTKEPFGLTVCESLVSGTPVVTYDRGPNKELIEHGKTGFLAQNKEEFKEYMTRVNEINPKDCRQSVFDNKFIPSRLGRDYIRIYRQVLKGKQW